MAFLTLICFLRVANLRIYFIRTKQFFKKNGGLKWSFQRTSRNERSSRVENGIFLSLFLFKISIFDDIVICIPTLPLTYCLIFSPLYYMGRYEAKEWKIGRKMEFRDYKPTFLPRIQSKTSLLSIITTRCLQTNGVSLWCKVRTLISNRSSLRASHTYTRT